MLNLLWLFVASLAFSLLLTPLARGLASHCGLLDEPDGQRKTQSCAIPRTGGLAVLVSVLLALTVLAALTPQAQGWFGQSTVMLGLGLGCVCLAAVGVADDRKLLGGRHKLLGQCLAATVVIWGGVVVRTVHLFGYGLDLGVFSVPFTVFFLLGAINSLNLLDGMDGLLSSLGVSLSLTLAVRAAAAQDAAAASVAMALAGALLGFLRYNHPPATIYLGDCGSMVVGLVIGTLAIRCSLEAPATVALTAPLVLLTLPIFDTFVAIVRRKLTGRSIYSADCGHVHHCLLRRGMTRPAVLLLLFGLCLLTDLGVLASQACNQEWIAVSTGAAVIGILVFARLFGHAELLLVKERLRSLGETLLFFGRPARAHQLEVRLQGCGAWKDMWPTLTLAAAEMGLAHLLLDVNAPALHEGYHARWYHSGAARQGPVWRTEIPLRGGGQIVGRLEISGIPDAEPFWLKIARVSELLMRFGLTVTHSATDTVHRPSTGLTRVDVATLR